ncbi:hypothetical protein [uncultured Sphingobacterium sp.]|uniref:hypothetical protein n=1 Tax=uncultured Sphingobacterium sp. TaxID=182688 RepID=UPI0037481C24
MTSHIETSTSIYKIFTKVFIAYTLAISNVCFAQSLSLKDAIEQGVENYGTLTAKQLYAEASQERVARVKRDYLPNLNLSAQQSYGTINGQNGPLYGLGGLGVSSSGLPLPEQNWNAAFGALYLVNLNWDFYTFGRV